MLDHFNAVYMLDHARQRMTVVETQYTLRMLDKTLVMT